MRKYINQFIISVFIIFGTLVTYATLPTVTSGSTLTSDAWNTIVNKINSLDNPLPGTFSDVYPDMIDCGVDGAKKIYKISDIYTDNTVIKYEYYSGYAGSYDSRGNIRGISQFKVIFNGDGSFSYASLMDSNNGYVTTKGTKVPSDNGFEDAIKPDKNYCVNKSISDLISAGRAYHF